MAQRTLYGSAQFGGSGNWDDLSNQWWLDTFNGSPADAIPTNGDIVYTDGSFGTGPASLVVLDYYDNTGAYEDIMDYSNVNISTSLNFLVGTWVNGVPLGVSANFSNYATNLGFIYGAAYFYGASNYGTVFPGGYALWQSANNYGALVGGDINMDSASVYNSVSTGGVFWGGDSISLDGGSNFYYSASAAKTAFATSLFPTSSPVASPAAG